MGTVVEGDLRVAHRSKVYDITYTALGCCSSSSEEDGRGASERKQYPTGCEMARTQRVAFVTVGTARLHCQLGRNTYNEYLCARYCYETVYINLIFIRTNICTLGCEMSECTTQYFQVSFGVCSPQTSLQ